MTEVDWLSATKLYYQAAHMRDDIVEAQKPKTLVTLRYDLVLSSNKYYIACFSLHATVSELTINESLIWTVRNDARINVVPPVDRSPGALFCRTRFVKKPPNQTRKIILRSRILKIVRVYPTLQHELHRYRGTHVKYWSHVTASPRRASLKAKIRQKVCDTGKHFKKSWGSVREWLISNSVASSGTQYFFIVVFCSNNLRASLILVCATYATTCEYSTTTHGDYTDEYTVKCDTYDHQRPEKTQSEYEKQW